MCWTVYCLPKDVLAKAYFVCLWWGWTCLFARSTHEQDLRGPMPSIVLPIVNGTRSIFLDLGSNLGVQLRKLFEPELYPTAKVHGLWKDWFGPPESRKDHVCAYAFEPDPSHTLQLQIIENVYRSRGYCVQSFVETAIGTRNRERVLYRDQNEKDERWGSSLITSRNKDNTKREAVRVREVDFSQVLLQVSENWRKTGVLPEQRVVVVKMDIEGAEYEVISHLIKTKTLCLIDFLFLEWHHQKVNFPGAFRTNPRYVRRKLDQAIRNCKEPFSLKKLHDETYLHDGRVLVQEPIIYSTQSILNTEKLFLLSEMSFSRVLAPKSVGSTKCTISLVAVIAVRFDETFPWFLEHYHNAKIPGHCFYLIFNLQNLQDAKLFTYINLARSYGVQNLFIWIGNYSSRFMFFARQFVQKHFIPQNSWIVQLDSDEFHWYSDVQKLLALIPKGYNCVKARLIDRVGTMGQLSSPLLGKSLFEQYPLKCHITRLLQKANTVKIALHRTSVTANAGHHSAFTKQQFSTFLKATKTITKNLSDTLLKDYFVLPYHSKPKCLLVRSRSRRSGMLTGNWISHFKWTSTVENRLAERVRFLQDDKMQQYSHGGAHWFLPVLEALSSNKTSLQKYCLIS